jgi:hypothetical protein
VGEVALVEGMSVGKRGRGRKQGRTSMMGVWPRMPALREDLVKLMARSRLLRFAGTVNSTLTHLMSVCFQT